jgi:hypothetical protein
LLVSPSLLLHPARHATEHRNATPFSIAAFADQLEKRRLDYEEITKRLQFPYIPSEASKSVAYYGHEEMATSQEPFISISSEQAGMVFWMGDLNCLSNLPVLNSTFSRSSQLTAPLSLSFASLDRVDLPDEEGWALVMKKDVKGLLLKDQLNRERAIGRVFAGFEEGDIRFPP